MSTSLPRALVSLCIRVQPTEEALAERLWDALERRQVPATWGLADPAASSIARQAFGKCCAQEIALALDPQWPAGDRVIARRLAEARAAGLHLSTVVVDGVLNDGQFESLARWDVRSVSAVRSADDKFARRSTQPAVPRYGVWCFSDAVSLPVVPRWFASGSSLRAVRRAVQVATSERGLVQIGIDLAAVAQRGAERTVIRVIELVERRRGIGQLDVATLERTAARLSGQYAGKPSRSILRPAA